MLSDNDTKLELRTWYTKNMTYLLPQLFFLYCYLFLWPRTSSYKLRILILYLGSLTQPPGSRNLYLSEFSIRDAGR